jgi:hypothetical protein
MLYSGYRNSHHHWWPITSTRRASSGGSRCVSKIVRTVGMPMNTTMSAGAIVHAISSLVLPWICSGCGAPGRSRKRIAANRISAMTRTRMPIVQSNVL